MNKIKLLGLGLIASAAAVFTSCDDYLEVKLNDQQTLEEVFNKRNTSLQYLQHVYSYLPFEAEYQGPNSNAKGGDGAVAVAMSDDAMFSWYQWVTYLNFRTGDWGPTSSNFNNWQYMYQGIEQAGIFMDNIDRCPDFTDKEKTIMKAEARFIRAFDYFQLFKRFGPVFIWGDRRADVTIKPEEIDRNTVDENIDFMIAEIDKAIEDLPLKLENGVEYDGRLTKGAAMAAKSRILLYAASPLYNGCDLYKGKMMNREGNYLFPQAYDGNKWEKAAKAAKDVIDLGIYELYKDESSDDPMTNAIKSYQGIQFVPWNCEIIWGYWPRMGGAATYNMPTFLRQRMLPPTLVKSCNGGYCASMWLFDAYPMFESGRFPVIGYNNNAADQPIVDDKALYDAAGNKKYTYSVTNNANDFVTNWEHPIEGDTYGAIEAHNTCVGRDARFYASIMANGFKWVNSYTATGKNEEVTFFKGGTSTFKDDDCVKSGFLWRRFLDPTLDYQHDVYGQYFWFYFRLGEIYLNYAEACNEKPNRDAAEALKYVNLIRERVGLNTLQEAYPEYGGNFSKEVLRDLIHRERRVELAFEPHRYFDVRRWMTATENLTNANWTLDLLATNYRASWERTTRVWAGEDNVFENKHYCFPIYQAQLNEMKNITQNYGW